MKTNDKIPSAIKLYRGKARYFNELNIKSVKPSEFYNDLFPAGSFEREKHPEDARGNGMLIQINEAHPINRIIFDDHKIMDEYLKQPNVIVSPVSYSGMRRAAKAARFCYAIAIDIDNVGYSQIRDLLYQAGNKIIPMPTYVVNSGSGIHVYYLFNDPIPMYPEYQKYLKELKHAMTERVWNDFTSFYGNDNRQYQGIVQGFRMVGSQTKLGERYLVKAYKTGNRVDCDYLMNSLPDGSVFYQRRKVDKAAKSALPLFNDEAYRKKLSAALVRDNKMSLDEAKKKYPDWYQRRVIEKAPAGCWTNHRSLYDWWLNRIRTEVQVGHRYYAIFTLAVFAQKCGITETELRKDAYSLLDKYEGKTVDEHNHFTQKDIEAALNSIKQDLNRFPIDEISRLSGLEIKKNKRNGRPQALHLKGARAIQNINDENGNWRNKNGRPTKQEIIQQWKNKHPNGKKIDCERDTGMSRHTVLKWW